MKPINIVVSVYQAVYKRLTRDQPGRGSKFQKNDQPEHDKVNESYQIQFFVFQNAIPLNVTSS
jgi:hypothetical protein